MISRRAVIASGLAAGLVPSIALARAPEIYMDQGRLLGRGWTFANDGFDVVAYHDLAEGAPPVKGDEAFQTTFKGETWLFASQKNLDAFVADPDRWRPQYGNHCAWAMARNKLAKGTPSIWSVYDGKLYLNISPRYQREWLANVDRDIARGDENWPGILDRN